MRMLGARAREGWRWCSCCFALKLHPYKKRSAKRREKRDWRCDL